MAIPAVTERCHNRIISFHSYLNWSTKTFGSSNFLHAKRITIFGESWIVMRSFRVKHWPLLFKHHFLLIKTRGKVNNGADARPHKSRSRGNHGTRYLSCALRRRRCGAGELRTRYGGEFCEIPAPKSKRQSQKWLRSLFSGLSQLSGHIWPWDSIHRHGKVQCFR